MFSRQIEATHGIVEHFAYALDTTCMPLTGCLDICLAELFWLSSSKLFT